VAYVFSPSDLVQVAPEIFILSMACVILIVDLFLDDRRRYVTHLLCQVTLLGAAVLTYMLGFGETTMAFSGAYIHDAFGDVLKIAMYVVTAAVFLYSRDYLKDRNLLKGEYFVLGLFGLLGMMIMVSAANLLVIYLGIELLALSLYALVAFDRDNKTAAEAAMKYFVLGAIASGMLLYGMSMIYGTTGTLSSTEIAARLVDLGSDDLVPIFGLVFIMVGIGFKLGVVPFHMWVPDIYQGAPTSVTLYIGSIPKIAGFALVMRLLVDTLPGLVVDWQAMLIILAVLSMAIGNIVAIAQTNIKRMLAYSTISHMGFLLLGVLSGTTEGYSSAMFYTLVYSMMALGSFGILLLMSRSGFDAEMLDDMKGLNRRSPWFAGMMLIMMFSMAGVPPMAGFYAKLSVLAAVVDIGLVWLAIVAVLFSVIGAFYYLRVIKLMYFDEPVDDSPLGGSADVRFVLSLNGLAVLGLGIFPAGLMGLCLQVLS